MSNAKRIIIAAVAVVVIAAGAVVYALVASNNSAAPEASPDREHTHEGAHSTDSTEVASTITYNGSSFSLSNSEVTSGAHVKITNDSSEELDFGSDPHPTHTNNPELNAGDIAPNESKTITLNAKGEWGFHNHYNPSQHSTITIK